MLETGTSMNGRSNKDKNEEEKCVVNEEVVESEESYGCKHYRRVCRLVTPCCNKIYTCRFCHNEEEEHKLNRKEVNELICASCETRQPVQKQCEKCEVRFAKYSCLECNLFDDDDADKQQFHCEGCELCRCGGRNESFHCAKCNTCLPLCLENNHKCVENVSRSNCPICLENLHDSLIACHVPKCGHLIHSSCYKALLKSGNFNCPECQVSLVNLSKVWEFMDMEVAMTPMPEEFVDRLVDILCKDCLQKSTTNYHVVGLKCCSCGSYNTCQI